MSATKEHKLLTSMLKGQPSPTVQTLRQLVAERARAEQRQRQRDSAKQRRAIDLMPLCDWCGVSQAVCRCL